MDFPYGHNAITCPYGGENKPPMRTTAGNADSKAGTLSLRMFVGWLIFDAVQND